MNKIIELAKSQKDENKILIANVLDKIKNVQARNRFESTDFLDLAQKTIIEEILEKRKENNYIFYGGFNQAERTMLVLFPSTYFDEKNFYNQIMSVIRIILPKDLHEKYEHKTYLGAIMKLGVKREKVGDILVRNDGADIIISKDIEKFLLNSLNGLVRFQKSTIEKINLEDIKVVQKEKQILKVNVPSMRLDAIVGELARVSRSEANNLIEQERVFVNFKEELRTSKIIEEGSIITIRGKGRFTISKIIGETRNKRINLEVEKW